MRIFFVALLSLFLAAACTGSKKATDSNVVASEIKSDNTSDRDGSSFEQAIMAKSVAAEYEWLSKNYVGYKFVKQSLVFEGKKPYDVLSIVTKEGVSKKVYFDISKFFGKF